MFDIESSVVIRSLKNSKFHKNATKLFLIQNSFVDSTEFLAVKSYESIFNLGQKKIFQWLGIIFIRNRRHFPKYLPDFINESESIIRNLTQLFISCFQSRGQCNDFGEGDIDNVGSYS